MWKGSYQITTRSSADSNFYLLKIYMLIMLLGDILYAGSLLLSLSPALPCRVTFVITTLVTAVTTESTIHPGFLRQFLSG